MSKRSIIRAALAATVLGIAVAGCATTARTTLDASWKAPAASAKSFRKITIVTVSADEFVQADVQKQLSAELKARGINAVPSGAYFTRYTAAERERFERTVRGSDADALLLARVTSTDSRTTTVPGALVGMSGTPYQQLTGVGNLAAATFDPSHYIPPSDSTQVTVHAEASILEKKGEKLVWVARARIDNADEGDYRKTVAGFVRTIIDAGIKEGMF
jgi:hypothetical protein